MAKEAQGLWRAADCKLDVSPAEGKVFLDRTAITHDQSERQCRARLFTDGSYSLVKACD